MTPQERVGAATLARGPVGLMEEVCRQRCVPVKHLVGRGRTQWLSDTRRIVVAGLMGLGMGVTDIGRLLGRDHSTICNLLRERTAPATAGRVGKTSTSSGRRSRTRTGGGR